MLSRLLRATLEPGRPNEGSPVATPRPRQGSQDTALGRSRAAYRCEPSRADLTYGIPGTDGSAIDGWLSYGDAMAEPIRVMIEQGKKKRVVACAFDWPGWDR